MKQIKAQTIRLCAVVYASILILSSTTNSSLAQSVAVPSLDDLAGDWQKAADLRSLPAVNSTQGSAQAVRDVLSIGKLSFPPITLKDETGSMTIDGQTPTLDQTRWYPYQIIRKGSAGDISVETSVRMIYDQKGILFHLVVTNNGTSRKASRLKIKLTAWTVSNTRWGWKIPRNADTSRFDVIPAGNGRSLLVRNSRDSLSNCFSFESKPEALTVTGNSGEAAWTITLRPKESRAINYVLAIGEKDDAVRQLALTSAAHFQRSFEKVKTDWAKRFSVMFKPGNPYFSGHLPVLRTSDTSLRRIYYMGAVSLLSVFRTCFPVAPRVYVSNTPESNCTMMYFWDTREWATTLALLDPSMMKQYLRSWLEKGIYQGYSEEYLTGTLQGVWYSANDYSIFVLLNDYLNVTGDRDFLSEKINGKSVLGHMDSLATHWKSLVRPGRSLADYGGIENLLECVPTYIHEVASFNAANVWMMRRVADIQESFGNKVRAGELRMDAGRLLPAVLDLYMPGQGVWYAEHRDGTRVQIRHVFDFATVGLTINDDLSPKMRDEMTDFVEHELFTKYWMRAQSLSDPAASVSDRPDHGPMGAYCAWPGETIAVLCEFGKFDQALEFLHRCTATTYEGPFSQSRELMGRTFDAPVRLNERGSGGFPTQTYNASNGGSFTETIIREFFGYQPDFLQRTTVKERRPRGFQGELRNVQQGTLRYDISSSDKGIELTKAK